MRRDENGLFAESRDDIFADSVRVFDGVYDAFPCLRMEDRVPKGVRFSTALSAMDFTGFYFPFTGEANLNIDSPACYLPSTIAHEMAHQRGIASEQECNFHCHRRLHHGGQRRLSLPGWLMGFTYLSNALYRADHGGLEGHAGAAAGHGGGGPAAKQRLLGGALRGSGKRRGPEGVRLLPQKQRREPVASRATAPWWICSWRIMDKSKRRCPFSDGDCSVGRSPVFDENANFLVTTPPPIPYNRPPQASGAWIEI